MLFSRYVEMPSESSDLQGVQYASATGNIALAYVFIKITVELFLIAKDQPFIFKLRSCLRPSDYLNHSILFPGDPLVVQIHEAEKQDNAEVALLGDAAVSPRRYATSELTQFWVVLKRTLLFSRRDWVIRHFILSYHFFFISRYNIYSSN